MVSSVGLCFTVPASASARSGGLRGHCLLHCSSLAPWSISVAVLPLPWSSLLAVCEVQQKESGCQTLTSTILQPLHPCRAA